MLIRITSFPVDTVARWHRWYLAEAFDAHGIVIGRLLEFLADTHREISKFAQHVCNRAKSLIQIVLYA